MSRLLLMETPGSFRPIPGLSHGDPEWDYFPALTLQQNLLNRVREVWVEIQSCIKVQSDPLGLLHSRVAARLARAPFTEYLAFLSIMQSILLLDKMKIVASSSPLFLFSGQQTLCIFLRKMQRVLWMAPKLSKWPLVVTVQYGSRSFGTGAIHRTPYIH